MLQCSLGHPPALCWRLLQFQPLSACARTMQRGGRPAVGAVHLPPNANAMQNAIALSGTYGNNPTDGIVGRACSALFEMVDTLVCAGSEVGALGESLRSAGRVYAYMKSVRRRCTCVHAARASWIPATDEAPTPSAD